MSRLEDLLIEHEGYRRFVYKDSVGIETVGIGRNLVDVGLSVDEARYLLRNDIQDARRECSNNFSWFNDLDQVRQDAIVNMCFNLGITRLKGFKKMIAACERHDWETASVEMMDSKWANQVGQRAVRLSDTMRKGEW